MPVHACAERLLPYQYFLAKIMSKLSDRTCMFLKVLLSPD